MQSVDIQTLLKKAEALCLSRSVRMTSQRKSILQLIAGQPGAISAYELLDLLRETEPQAKPPTIYRGLEFLLEQGFIHKIESTNSFVMCPHFDKPSHTSVLFICDRCNSVTERDGEAIDSQITQLADAAQFHIRHSVIEAHGHCRPCYDIESCTRRDKCLHDHEHDEPRKRGR
ncbi:zinc uptake transcriptional repressor Zur [Morganella morganii]|uniref:zinc uptake transcriptional repressor Zur n=1 Tax=Morganella morganii TaxID=582 RepID=UPI003EBC371A